MHKRSAFTLIEMLLATILTAVLMVGVLAVIARIANPMQHASDIDTDATPYVESEMLVQIFAADLAHARTIHALPGELRLMGYTSLEPQRRTRTQRPTHIHYRVASVDRQPWLLRDEYPLDGQTKSISHTELIAQGVTRIALDPPSDLPATPARFGAGHRTLEDKDALPADGLWRLRLWNQGGGEPFVDHHLVMRRPVSP